MIVALLPQIAVAIIIVVVAAAVAAAVKDLVSGATGGLSYGRFLATGASAFIIGLGLIAALSHVGIAIAVTLPVLITVLAVVGGILVVGVGGGLVAPMRQRWERVLDRVEQEGPRAAAEVQAASRATRQPYADATSAVTTTPIGVGALASDPAAANGNSGSTSTRRLEGGDR
jgi:hypothetical protein